MYKYDQSTYTTSPSLELSLVVSALFMDGIIDLTFYWQP